MKVAIYSGVIPSTVFIENLISIISKNDVEVYLFGTKTTKYNPPSNNVKIYATPSNKYARLFFTIKYLFIAIIRYPNRVKHLLKKVGLEQGMREKLNRLSKTLPVITNLPDIFHIQWAKSVEEWMFLKEMFGVKLILSLRGAHINYSPFCNEALANSYRKNFPKFDGFHAVSEAIIENAKLFGAKEEDIKVIYSGVNTVETDNYLSENSYNFHRVGAINLLSVGRFHWKKGYKYAVDACKILKDKGVDFKYTIIASGDSLETRLQIQSLELENQIEIIPGLDHDSVLDQIYHSDIFLLPSIEEGIANVVLEAMALKKAVVVSNCGGMAEAIIHQKNGILVKPMDSVAIANGVMNIDKMTANDIQKMVNYGYKTINEKFGLEGLGIKMISFYKETIHNN